MQPTNTSLDTLTRPSHEMTNDDNSQLQTQQNPPAYTPPKARKQEDWEDWEDDDDIVTPIDAGEQVNPPPATITITPPRANPRTSKRTSKQPVPRSSKHATGRIKRKSRQRQKAQNAQAGIKLITDMSAFRRPNAVAQQLKTPDGRPIKFVDAAALRALEGEPNSASVGNWNWLKRNKNQSPVAQPPAPENPPSQSPAAQTQQATQSPRQLQQQQQHPVRTPEPVSPRLPINSSDHVLSPQDRPIVIGITLDSSEYDNRDFSSTPTTALDFETPVNPPPSRSPANAKTPPLTTSPDPAPQKSVWSPDTPDTAFSFNSGRIPSTISSQVQPQSTGSSEKVPPVPALPGTYKKLPHRRLVSLEGGNDDDDTGTPCTLFEEDGITSPLKQPKGKHPVLTPESASSNNGWWDHVVTPFMDKRLSFAARKPKLDSPREDKEDEWWIGADPKRRSDATPMTTLPPTQYLTPKASPVSFQTPIVRAPTPRRSPSPRVGTSAALESGPSTARSSPVPETFSVRDSLRETSSVPDTASIHEAYSVPQASPTREKPRIILTPEIPAEQPPPYSPPKKKALGAARYGSDFYSSHSSRSQYSPSGSEAPGLSATMTSQGNNHLTDVPITPAGIQTRSPLSQLALPDRPVGTYLPPEHAREARGEENRVERQRRRHEKEDVVARKAGGFWRGRGCVPKGGCYGRTGREGRKKRRRCCMFCCCIFLVLAILAIVLGVVLTRPKHSKEVPSIWVNLTDYPPMPTGILSMVGSDNTVSRSGCTEPSTLWSCSLPKEQHDSVAPYTHNQPTIIMNIQWDNDTRNSWKVPNGDAPEGVSRRSPSGAALAGDTIQKRQRGFTPSPSPPEFQEMWFLGNTTDGIQSDEKGGEPTPFYISVVNSLNASGTVLGKRADDSSNISLPSLLPSPDLNEDGTPKPAVLIPRPVQQPVRLYDRGLPTEHYGFYSYFKRTIFLRSVTVVNATDENDIPLDENGGCRETEADFLVTWSETRFLVRIWTKALDNKSSLLSSSGQPSINGTAALVRPGTMPYPVTVTIDTHGGEQLKKFVWNWPIDKRQQVDDKSPKLLSNDIGFAGTWINKRSTGSAKFGGYDGGTGGCKCEWANWV